MEIANKYFINRLGYAQCKEITDCKTIYDLLGYITINITKNNEKSFRYDYNDELYKHIPTNWWEFDDIRLHSFALNRIAYILTNDSFYDNIERARLAFKVLSDDDKMLVCKLIKDIVDKKFEEERNIFLKEIDTKLIGDDFYNQENGILEKYLPKN